MAVDYQALQTSILTTIRKAQQEQISYANVFENPQAQDLPNEFLFFIKPELTLNDPKIQVEKILSFILGKIQTLGFEIKNAKVLSANYLEKYDIIAQHYGVINKIASDAKNQVSDGAKEKFKELFGLSMQEATVLGGVEFLKKYPEFTPLTLDYLCQNKKAQKLAGGTYGIDLKLDAETVYLINGFHPRQLIHFTAKGRSIVVFTLASKTSWAEARNNFIGATNPSAAQVGSIRRELLDRQAEFGLAEVSQGSNGVHLSAGAVEGLIELTRYNSDFASNQVKKASDFSFGKKLAASFSADQVEKILSNPNLSVDGKQVSIFDLTEEKNSEDAIALLKKYVV